MFFLSNGIFLSNVPSRLKRLACYCQLFFSFWCKPTASWSHFPLSSVVCCLCRLNKTWPVLFVVHLTVIYISSEIRLLLVLSCGLSPSSLAHSLSRMWCTHSQPSSPSRNEGRWYPLHLPRATAITSSLMLLESFTRNRHIGRECDPIVRLH